MEEIMVNFKRIITAIVAAVLIFGMLPFGAMAEAYSEGLTFTVPTAEADGGDKPLITVGTISDPHADYNLQNKDPYIRQSFITAMDTLKAEGIDLLLVGGDMTSDNQDNGGDYRWEPDVYARTLEQYRKYASAASTTGMTLWACGNHDSEVGTLKSTLSSDDYNSYQGFIDMMLATCGDPVDFYTQGEDPDYNSSSLREDYWLGAHYNIKGFDFIVINPPYASSLFYSEGVLSWLDETLEKIGADKTVFITGHYPLTDNRGISTPSYGLNGSAYTNFVNVMNKYDNAIYLYGHNHGGAESVYISSDTFERITHYDANGKVINDRSVNPTSFITAFMGSASYYKYSLNPDWLGAADPYIVQAMTISVYADRIEFKMINCGKRVGKEENPTVWTATREVKYSGETATNEPILVSEGKVDGLFYDITHGIKSYEMPSGAKTLTAGYHKIEAEGLDSYEDLVFTAKRLYFGSKYTGYMRKLSTVVNDAVVFEYTVTSKNKKVDIETPVKVTLPALINEFGEKTGELEVAAYYWDTEGKLCMTDVQVNDDGTYSFIMTNISAFALSERAKTEAQPKAEGGEKDNTVIIAVVAIALVAVVAVVCAVIFIKPKKSAAKGETEGKDSEK